MATRDDPSNSDSVYFNDPENVAEMARLLGQDHLITKGMGGLFSERFDLSGVHRILDVACGPGGWALEVASTYPEIEVVGVDVSRAMIAYANTQARVQGLDKASFQVMDEGNISYANASAARILGIPVQDLAGVSFHQHARSYPLNDVHDRQALPWNFVVINALLGKTASSQETVVVKPEGNTLIMLSSSAPLRNEEGSITGAVIVFQDITAQKMIERQKNAFLSLASHELRTPVTAIAGFAEILQLKDAHNEGLNPISRHAIAQIVAQSDQLTRLIEEMFDLTRLENAQLSLNCGLHDLHAILKEVIESQEIT